MFKKFIAISVIAFSSFSAYAGETNCPTHYLKGVAPEITNPPMKAKTQELCYLTFGVMHSGISRTPLWSAEHLIAANIKDAKTIQRVNNFHAESALPEDQRAELKYYVHSGYDRGHMSPSADMPTPESQQESFTLANMVPQNPNNNRHVWENIESTVRTLALKQGELYVITGPLFEGGSIQQIHSRVMVPTSLYKILYDLKEGKGAAYLVKNADTTDFTTVSIAELEKRSGINFFPSMSASDKEAKLELPAPHTQNHR